MEYERPPPTREGLAAAIAEGRTVMWCDRPVLDGRAAVDEHLCVEGWAYCKRGLDEVVVLVDGHRHPAPHRLPRADVDKALPAFGGHVSGFRHVLDTRGWASGPHELSVVAVGRDGRAVGQGGNVTCGPDLPYRAWREGRGSAPTRAVASSAKQPPVIVCVLKTGASGAGLADSLERQTHSWSLGEGDLGVTLEEIAGSNRRGVLVEDSGFLDPTALARLSAAMGADPPADLVYTDEDAVAADGGRAGAFFKPAWSPELLLSTDYVGPLVGVSARAARAVLDAATDPPVTIYDLLLRLVDTPVRVERVPKVLFTSHRPRVPSDDARVREALERLGARREHKPRIRRLALAGTREVSWEVVGEPLVSIVIPTSYSRGLVRACLRSIRERTNYDRLEVVIVDSSKDRLASAEPELAGLEHRVVSYEGEFNFSKAVNQAAQAANGDYLMLLNDDTEVRSADWVRSMLAHAQAPGVGVVGCRLIYWDGRIQHGGVGVHAGMPWHLYLGFPGDAPGYRGMLGLARNCSAVTGACMLVSSDLFAELGGLDESMAINFSDTDFCLRTVETGRRVVWTPHAVLVHHERSSFSPRSGWGDVERFTGRWSAPYAGGDPFYHPAFMPSLDYELRPKGASRQPIPKSSAEPAASEPGATPSALPLQDLEPIGPPPRKIDEINAAISSGRPVMRCDEPKLDARFTAFGFLRVSGWAYARPCTEVFVYLDGRPHQPRLGMSRNDLSSRFGKELRHAGFSVVIDLDAHRAGLLELVVAARSPDGVVVGVRGKVECRPTPAGVRPPGLEAVGAAGDTAVPDAGSALREQLARDGWRGRLIALEQESRYRWAAGLARGLDVLDIPCGVGYGTSLLAGAGARHALGVDVSPDTIDEARERAGDFADFVVGDLRDLPPEDRSFDLVTCFETIGIGADLDRALDELRRVLRPDGVLLLSAPSRDVNGPGIPPQESTPAALEDALSARFAHTRLYRQQNHLASVICGDETSPSARLEQVETDMPEGVAGVAGEELSMVAAASDAPLPSLHSVGTLGDLCDVKAWYERALAWEERALEAEAWEQAHRATHTTAKIELDRLFALQAAIQGSLSWRLTRPLRAVGRGVRSVKHASAFRRGRVRRSSARERAEEGRSTSRH